METNSIQRGFSRDNFIVDLLDRFEILYGDKVTNPRRFYNDGHMLDILRIIGNEDLRKFVEERNYLSLFRYQKIKVLKILKIYEKCILKKMSIVCLDYLVKIYDELRKVVTEDNVHSLFRLVGDEHEDLRKTVVEENLHSPFRLLGDKHEDPKTSGSTRKYSTSFDMLGPDYEDLRKAIFDKNIQQSCLEY